MSPDKKVEQSRVDYWNAKIGRWAESCYDAKRADMMAKMRSSVDARKQETKRLLAEHFKPGFTLVDLGCGAGQLVLEAVTELGAAQACGFDFSAAGIQVAKEMRDAAGIAEDRARFEVADVSTPIPQCDVVTGLGLLDWLDESQIRELFLKLKGRKFIISYSEEDWSPAEIVHRVWLVWRLRLKGRGVRAYHHSRRMIFGMLEDAGIRGVAQVNAPAMRFGRLIHNLDSAD